jgi:regulator of protease activity HflC (stomatin/prohibitin superfamily)
VVVLSSVSSSILDPFDKIVSQRRSGNNAILGVLVIILGIGIGFIVKSDLILYLSLIAGVAIIFSSFLMIIRQYERAIILRLGRYKRQVGPGIQTRFPFADNVLVVDIRERVSDVKDMLKCVLRLTR